jgi:hypothetical protein
VKLNRNPLVAALAAATLLIAGCGTATQLTGPSTKQAQVRGLSQAQVRSLAEEPMKPAANKDWQVLNGTVAKLLPDDNDGSRHQHFLVEVAPKKLVKVAHNIDLAAYVPVKVGDAVVLKCEFIKSSPYDVAHWTHYDPRGGEGGYIELNGKKYDRL